MTHVKTFCLAAAMALAATAAPAHAQDARDGHASVGVTAGTLGIGPEVGYRFNETVGVRANATFLSLHHSFDSDDIDYRGNVDLRSGGAIVDIYPFGGGFRISGGARINGNKGRLSATPTTNTRIGNATFTPTQIGTISGRAETRDFVPQATIGYGGSLGQGFSIGVEAGALFQGRVRIRDFAANGTLASNPIFISQLEEERRDLQDDVDDYRVYPILQLNAKYRF